MILSHAHTSKSRPAQQLDCNTTDTYCSATGAGRHVVVAESKLRASATATTVCL